MFNPPSRLPFDMEGLNLDAKYDNTRFNDDSESETAI